VSARAADASGSERRIRMLVVTAVMRPGRTELTQVVTLIKISFPVFYLNDAAMTVRSGSKPAGFPPTACACNSYVMVPFAQAKVA
jgi:hypothetical protein